jgi:hypothetical protein
LAALLAEERNVSGTAGAAVLRYGACPLELPAAKT